MTTEQFIKTYGYGDVTINLNDTFVPAADSETVDLKDIPLLIELHYEFGELGVLAWVANKHGITSSLWKRPKEVNDKFNEIKSTLRERYGSV